MAGCFLQSSPSLLLMCSIQVAPKHNIKSYSLTERAGHLELWLHYILTSNLIDKTINQENKSQISQ